MLWWIICQVEACQGGKGTNEFTVCHLHPFRFSTDPFAEVSDAKRERGKKLAASTKRKEESLAIPA